ncbi:MAG TPA: TIGR01244 family sulfur transferase [Candidatus Binatia bacterium]|nr:TIGR01244 family sulfur transferase [Candidatus Binatia bacterium]
MTEFRQVTPDFSVAGQIDATDVSRIAALGYKTIINNRPDREEPGQPSIAEIRAAAEGAGLRFHNLPFVGQAPPAVVAETASVLEQTPGPVLAYCRTGTRSIKAWALAAALSGTMRPDEIIALAGKAGYDLEGARGALVTLAPKS